MWKGLSIGDRTVGVRGHIPLLWEAYQGTRTSPRSSLSAIRAPC